MHCVILLTLLMRPLRMKFSAGSCAQASTWIAPSGCLRPAKAVTLDEPSSIATIKLSSFAITMSYIYIIGIGDDESFEKQLSAD